MKNRTFLITSWSEEEYNKCVTQLEKFGVAKDEIELVTTERISRPGALNAAIERSDSEYVFLVDADLRLMHFDPNRMIEILKTRKDIGLVAVPAIQMFEGVKGLEFRTPIDKNTPIDQSLKNISRLLATLNCVVIRKSDQVKFDEDLFANQVLDCDYGWELACKGLKCVADCSQGLIHVRTNWASKNIFYHMAVARNLHILCKKWQNREVWPGLREFNKKNNNMIPTLEEMTSWSDEKVYNYISTFDQRALNMYFHKARFSDVHKISDYLKNMEQIMKQPQKFQFYVNEQGMPNFKVLDI